MKRKSKLILIGSSIISLCVIAPFVFILFEEKLLISKAFSARERIIVKLKYWNNWKAKEIAQFVKLPQRKIYSILEKVLNTLRKKALE